MTTRSNRASLIAQLVKNLPVIQETPVRLLGWEDPLEKGKVTLPSTLAWRIPYSPWGHRVGHNWATFTLFFPGASDGNESACKVGDQGSIPEWGRSLEKEMATHSSILALKIPWMEKSGRPQSIGSQRIRQDWATSLTHRSNRHKPPSSSPQLSAVECTATVISERCSLGTE